MHHANAQRQRAYYLAFDHIASLEKAVGPNGSNRNGRTVDFGDIKEMIYSALAVAIDSGRAPADAMGILVDEEHGGVVSSRAKADGVAVAMPAEKSLSKPFELQYGEHFDEHIRAFDPDFVKVLAFHDAAAADDWLGVQIERLRSLSDWLAHEHRGFMLEFIIPPTAQNLASVGGDRTRFETEVRPGLMVQAVEQMQDAGIEPDMWKVEGLSAVDDYHRLVEATQRGGRQATCVVLGKGAEHEVVCSWLRSAAVVDGFVGFAIGRTAWVDAVKQYVQGGLSAAEASKAIAERYCEYVEIYESAAA